MNKLLSDMNKVYKDVEKLQNNNDRLVEVLKLMIKEIEDNCYTRGDFIYMGKKAIEEAENET